MAERRKFSDYEKKSVYAKCNWTCAICGNPVKYKKMTVDHIIPLSKGGTNAMDNLQLACKRCNLMKADFSPDEFIRKIREITKYQRTVKIKSMFAKETL